MPPSVGGSSLPSSAGAAFSSAAAVFDLADVRSVRSPGENGEGEVEALMRAVANYPGAGSLPDDSSSASSSSSSSDSLHGSLLILHHKGLLTPSLLPPSMSVSTSVAADGFQTIVSPVVTPSDGLERTIEGLPPVALLNSPSSSSSYLSFFQPMPPKITKQIPIVPPPLRITVPAVPAPRGRPRGSFKVNKLSPAQSGAPAPSASPPPPKRALFKKNDACAYVRAGPNASPRIARVEEVRRKGEEARGFTFDYLVNVLDGSGKVSSMSVPESALRWAEHSQGDVVWVRRDQKATDLEHAKIVQTLIVSASKKSAGRGFKLYTLALLADGEVLERVHPANIWPDALAEDCMECRACKGNLKAASESLYPGDQASYVSNFGFPLTWSIQRPKGSCFTVLCPDGGAVFENLESLVPAKRYLLKLSIGSRGLVTLPCKKQIFPFSGLTLEKASGQSPHWDPTNEMQQAKRRRPNEGEMDEEEEEPLAPSIVVDGVELKDNPVRRMELKHFPRIGDIVKVNYKQLGWVFGQVTDLPGPQEDPNTVEVEYPNGDLTWEPVYGANNDYDVTELQLSCMPDFWLSQRSKNIIRSGVKLRCRNCDRLWEFNKTNFMRSNVEDNPWKCGESGLVRDKWKNKVICGSAAASEEEADDDREGAMHRGETEEDSSGSEIEFVVDGYSFFQSSSSRKIVVDMDSLDPAWFEALNESRQSRNTDDDAARQGGEATGTSSEDASAEEEPGVAMKVDCVVTQQAGAKRGRPEQAEDRLVGPNAVFEPVDREAEIKFLYGEFTYDRTKHGNLSVSELTAMYKKVQKLTVHADSRDRECDEQVLKQAKAQWASVLTQAIAVHDKMEEEKSEVRKNARRAEASRKKEKERDNERDASLSTDAATSPPPVRAVVGKKLPADDAGAAFTVKNFEARLTLLKEARQMAERARLREEAAKAEAALIAERIKEELRAKQRLPQVAQEQEQQHEMDSSENFPRQEDVGNLDEQALRLGSIAVRASQERYSKLERTFELTCLNFSNAQEELRAMHQQVESLKQDNCEFSDALEAAMAELEKLKRAKGIGGV